MPRKRANPEMAWLPPRVYIHRNNFVYQPKGGGKIILCPTSAGKIEVLKRHEQEKGRIDSGIFFENVIKDFFASPQFLLLRPRTQKDYELYKPTLIKVFGRMRPDAIEPRHVRMFMDQLAVSRGTKSKPANATSNRHKACLQKICSWAYERGKIKRNPCVGVVKLPEAARERYITDQEYQAIYDHASPMLKVAMELSYLCMARLGDVANLSMHEVHEEGLFIAQGKTGKKQIKLWSERLRAAVKDARALPRKTSVQSIYLLCKPDGSKYTARAIQDHFKKARELSGVVGCTFHDIKAKAISDFDGTLAEKSDAAGHTNLNMTKRYDRKIAQVKPVR